jgi:hypothetical protein
MNYLEWNNAIISHFFDPINEEKEVMLYFSENIIIEIGESKFEKPDRGYLQDFYEALKLGVSGIPNYNYIERILRLEQRYIDGVRAIDAVTIEYPPYFTYLLAFILPFTSGHVSQEFNMNNFHDYVQVFFEEKELCKNYDKVVKNNLFEIDRLWGKINDWLIDENNFSLGYLEEVNPPVQRKYVGKFEYHILFRKEQEERLSNVFDENNILPGGVISEAEIRILLANNYQQLKLSEATRSRIRDIHDYVGNIIVRRARAFYKSWNGITHTVEGQRGYSRNRLALCLDFNSITRKINFKYFRIFSKEVIPENLKFQNHDEITILNEFHQVNSFYSNPLINCFTNVSTACQLVDFAARSKYTWKAKDFYLFKKISNFDWVEIPKVEYNVGKTLVVSKDQFFQENLKKWFEDISGSKVLYNNSETQLENGWIAFTIDAISNHPHTTIEELIIDLNESPKIVFDKSFYIDGKLFKDKLPIVWLENTEKADDIIAKYEDGSEVRLNHHTTQYEGVTSFVNKFSFTNDHVNKIRLNQKFKLVCDDISTHRFLVITDFKKIENGTIENLLLKRDEIGQMTDAEENYFRGLEFFFKKEDTAVLILYQKLLNDLFINQHEKLSYNNNGVYDPLHLGNILLHYISTKGQLTKKEFEDCIFSLLRDTTAAQTCMKKSATQLGYLLQDFGYLDYFPEKSHYTINKPHLVVIPRQRGTTFKLIGAIDENLMKRILAYCRQNTNVTIVIQSDTINRLLPQAIYLQLRQCRHELIKPLTTQFQIIFKKSNLFTQFALTAIFPDISRWKTYINRTSDGEIKDIEGGYLFDLESLKFINKPHDFDHHLSFIRFTNINGFKTIYRLWHDRISYNIPDQQLGIYLYLYLFRKIKCDNYDNCVNEKGLSNCSAEKQLKDNAQVITNIVIYDENTNVLAVPMYCKLPRYFSISFQLLSGETPVLKYLNLNGVRHKGMYHIYQNIPKLFLHNTLNNKLLKRDLVHPILKKEIIL